MKYNLVEKKALESNCHNTKWPNKLNALPSTWVCIKSIIRAHGVFFSVFSKKVWQLLMLFNAISSTCICIKTIIRAHGSFIQNELTNSTPTLPHAYRSTASSEYMGSFFLSSQRKSGSCWCCCCWVHIHVPWESYDSGMQQNRVPGAGWVK